MSVLQEKAAFDGFCFEWYFKSGWKTEINKTVMMAPKSVLNIYNIYIYIYIYYSFQQHLQDLLPPHDRNWTGQQVLRYDPNLSLILIKSCFTEVFYTFRVLQTAYLIMKNLHKYLCSAAVTNSSICLPKKTGESTVCQLKHILYLHVVLV